MRFSTRTGLKLDKREAERLSLAHEDLLQIGRITDNAVFKDAAEHVLDSLRELGLASKKSGVSSPSGDTSYPLPPSQAVKGVK